MSNRAVAGAKGPLERTGRDKVAHHVGVEGHEPAGGGERLKAGELEERDDDNLRWSSWWLSSVYSVSSTRGAPMRVRVQHGTQHQVANMAGKSDNATAGNKWLMEQHKQAWQPERHTVTV